MGMVSVGQIVHYVSHGTLTLPDGTQVYASECRAAIVTAARQEFRDVSLCVLNPEGMFFNQQVPSCETLVNGAYPGGTWHEPEHVPGARPPRH